MYPFAYQFHRTFFDVYHHVFHATLFFSSERWGEKGHIALMGKRMWFDICVVIGS